MKNDTLTLIAIFQFYQVRLKVAFISAAKPVLYKISILPSTIKGLKEAENLKTHTDYFNSTKYD